MSDSQVTPIDNDVPVQFSRKIEKLKTMKIGNHEFMYNAALGYYPYFTMELKKRIKRQKVNNVLVTGEGGLGKTYQASDICRVLSRKFDTDDIVFTYVEFLRAVMTSGRGIPICFDEPSYAVSAKDWYTQISKSIVKTVESFRFKGKPLFIPIINQALITSDIRKYLIQFHVIMHDRGYATAYRTYPSQWDAKTYRYEICKLRYALFDNNLCNKKSCLTCRKLKPSKKSNRCPIFRARYERKKAGTQQERYEVALEEAELKETSKLTLDEIQAKAMLLFDKFYDTDKNKIDVDLLSIVLKREHQILLGHNKLYRLRKQISYDHPEFFLVEPEIHKDNVEEKLSS